MSKFKTIVGKLKAHYGAPESPVSSDPFELILMEIIAYLADDSHRKAAFELLRQRVGTQPADIAAASLAELTDIARIGGIHAELRAQRLKECAHIVLNDFGGELSKALAQPLPRAIKALKQFPSIGEPGAEKILLFPRAYPILALDSNGLRVCLRLGFGEEKKNYAASYKSAREALQGQTGADYDFLIGAHQLLRQHGKEICRRSQPQCDRCPLTRTCRYFQYLNFTRTVS